MVSFELFTWVVALYGVPCSLLKCVSGVVGGGIISNLIENAQRITERMSVPLKSQVEETSNSCVVIPCQAVDAASLPLGRGGAPI